MIDDVWLRWALTVCFGATGLWSVGRIVVDRGVIVSVGHGLHALMSAAMVAMTWPWGIWPTPETQAVFFLLAAAWFGAVAWFRPRESRGLGRAAWHLPYHAVMMAAMAWMVFGMIPPDGVAAVHHHHHDPPTWFAAVGVLLLLAMVAGAVAFAVIAAASVRVRSGDAGRAGGGAAVAEALSHALMSAGMAVMIVPMVGA